MKKVYCILAVSLLTCFPLFSNASMMGSKIPLTGGNIGPNKDIEIFFDGLLESVVYEVHCDAITSNGKSKNDIDYIALYANTSNLQPAINGRSLNQTWQAEILVKQSNDLSLRNVTTATSSIVIRNLDDTDTISVNNCWAFPQV